MRMRAKSLARFFKYATKDVDHRGLAQQVLLVAPVVLDI